MNHNDVFLPAILALDTQIKEICNQMDVADPETRRRLYKTRTLLEASLIELKSQQVLVLRAMQQEVSKPVKPEAKVTDWVAIARDLESRFGLKLTPTIETESEGDDDPDPPHAGGAALPVKPIGPFPVRFGSATRSLEEARELECVVV
jgi:hypothetical protein